MTRGRWPGLIVALHLLTVGRPAEAKPKVDDSRPFVAGGVYDKPYLTRLLGRATLGGYAEVHGRYQRVDGVEQEFSFVPKRFNLFTSTQVSDFVRTAAEIEFENASQIHLETAIIDISVHSALRFRAGMLLSPLGRFNLSHDSPRNEFTDRPLVATDLLGVTLSEPGMGLFGAFDLKSSGRLTYEAYATNGFSDGLLYASPAGTRIPLGRRNFQDENLSPAGVSRVAWSPRPGIELGVSTHQGTFNRFRRDGLRLDRPRLLSIYVFDAETRVLGVVFRGELAVVRADVPSGLSPIYARAQHGAYVEAVRDFGTGWIRTMPASYFSLGVRWDAIDRDGGLPGDGESKVTLGANFRPTRDTVVKLNFVRGRTRDRFDTPSDHSAILTSVATYF